MPDIVLTTLNAKFIHAAFGLRYLLANLGPLRERASLVEFDIHQRPVDVVEALLARNPRIVGFGVYVWNVAVITEIVAVLKRVRPEVIVVLGGPEVSFEYEQQAVVNLADYVITGEADLAFADLCRQLLGGGQPPESLCEEAPGGGRRRFGVPPLGGWGVLPAKAGTPNASSQTRTDKIIAAPLPDLNHVALPYDGYTEDDIAHRIIYVEASRGCPFSCEFCLSSLDIPVRQFPLERFLSQMQRLLDRGVKQFKFVDRTFNLNLSVGRAILQFLLERHRPGYFFHFEMVPDRLPDSLRELIIQFPPSALQFEIGIQTFNPEVAQRISRRQDYAKLEDNVRFLRERTGVHLHSDLIVGLPGESLESFAAGFDRLIALGPQEIQVGILKRLRGAPIARHDQEWQIVYNPEPPYEILQNRLLDFATMQRLRRFARYWDLVGNSGNFVETAPLLWSACGSPFAGFMRWSEWLFKRIGRTDSIALLRLAELLFTYLTEELGYAASTVAEQLCRDWKRAGRREMPEFLRPHYREEAAAVASAAGGSGNKRQLKHLGSSHIKTGG